MLYLKWQNEKGEIKFMISFYLNSKRTAPVFYNIEFINYNNEDEMMAFPGGKIDPKKIPPPVPPPPPLPKEKTGKDGVPPPPPPPPPGNY